MSAYYARRPGGTAGRCIIVLRDVVDSYLFRMRTFHVTSHCIIGPTGSSMNKHSYSLYFYRSFHFLVFFLLFCSFLSSFYNTVHLFVFCTGFFIYLCIVPASFSFFVFYTIVYLSFCILLLCLPDLSFCVR